MKSGRGRVKAFGCIAYVYVLDERRTKMDPKEENASSLGILYSKNGIVDITLSLTACK